MRKFISIYVQMKFKRKLKIQYLTLMMTYREDLIFVTHMKFDFVSGEEKRDNHDTYTSIIVQVNMCIREHARLYVCYNPSCL
jgi:hypothetical protein